MEEQLLIVDGYNMVSAWSELVQLKKQERLEDACELFLSRLFNCAKCEGLEIIMVFDAQLVPGIQQTCKKHPLTVVFTKGDETADSYIECLAGEKNDRLTQVTAATSDLVERWVVFSQGALRTSTNELYKAVQKTKRTVVIHATDIHFQ